MVLARQGATGFSVVDPIPACSGATAGRWGHCHPIRGPVAYAASRRRLQAHGPSYRKKERMVAYWMTGLLLGLKAPGWTGRVADSNF